MLVGGGSEVFAHCRCHILVPSGPCSTQGEGEPLSLGRAGAGGDKELTTAAGVVAEMSGWRWVALRLGPAVTATSSSPLACTLPEERESPSPRVGQGPEGTWM